MLIIPDMFCSPTNLWDPGLLAQHWINYRTGSLGLVGFCTRPHQNEPPLLQIIQTPDTEPSCCCNKPAVKLNYSQPHDDPPGPQSPGSQWGDHGFSLTVRPHSQPPSALLFSHQSISEGGVCSVGRGPRLPAGVCRAHTGERNGVKTDRKRQINTDSGTKLAFKLKAYLSSF